MAKVDFQMTLRMRPADVLDQLSPLGLLLYRRAALRAQSLRPADERIALEEEPQLQIVRRGDADSRGTADFAPSFLGIAILLDPESGANRQIPAVQGAVNTKRLTQFRRAVGILHQTVPSTPLFHQGNPIQRSDGAHQDRTGHILRFGDHVETTASMDWIDVRMPRRPKHRGVLSVSAE